MRMEYYQVNKSEIREKQRQYYKAIKDKITERHKDKQQTERI